MQDIDQLLKELPGLDSELKPDINSLIYNLGALEGLFMSLDMVNAGRTMWWTEQLLQNGD